VKTQKPFADRLHDAMHRIPLVPAHERATERAAGRDEVNTAARERATRWNDGLNAAARQRAARWNSNARGRAIAHRAHARPPRVLAGWQAWIGGRKA
jgi:hypothetical protein